VARPLGSADASLVFAS